MANKFTRLPRADQGYKSFNELNDLIDKYNLNKLQPTPKEKLIINPKVAYHVTKADILKAIPSKWIAQNKDLYGVVTKPSMQDPVSNTNWDYLYFTDSSVFAPAGRVFEKSKKAVKGTKIKPSYTPHVKGTKAYNAFWKEEFRRIVQGYEPIIDGKPCGVRISGEYYFYLNYCVIQKIVEMPDGTTKDMQSFPDFLTMDYYYFKELEARENPESVGFDPHYKKSICLAKSRRKGFSFKAASGACWVCLFNNNVRVGIASEAHSTDDTDAVKCAKKCIPIIDHMTKYTPFGRKDPGDPKNNGGWKHEVPKITKSQFSLTLGLFNTKTKAKRGRQSTIFTMSMTKDDAASGEGLHRLYFEEAGKIANLDKAWIFSKETMKAGSLFRGIAIIFGVEKCPLY